MCVWERDALQGTSTCDPPPFSVQTPLLPHHLSDSSYVQFYEFSHSWPLSAEDKAVSMSKSHSTLQDTRFKKLKLNKKIYIYQD